MVNRRIDRLGEEFESRPVVALAAFGELMRVNQFVTHGFSELLPLPRHIRRPRQRDCELLSLFVEPTVTSPACSLSVR